jgi:hypothetical protein
MGKKRRELLAQKTKILSPATRDRTQYLKTKDLSCFRLTTRFGLEWHSLTQGRPCPSMLGVAQSLVENVSI